MDNKIKSNLLEWSSGKVKGFYGKDFIKMDNGSVKLVKVDAHATYPLHVHPDKTEYAYVLEGNTEFEIDNQQYSSEPGDFFIFPRGKKHAIINNTNEDCLLLVGAIVN